MMPILRELTADTLATLGAAALSYGAWLAWAPAGFMTLGVCLAGAAYFVVRPTP
jgi:hypothetical protein